jgi:hypothetical protein
MAIRSMAVAKPAHMAGMRGHTDEGKPMMTILETAIDLASV